MLILESKNKSLFSSLFIRVEYYILKLGLYAFKLFKKSSNNNNNSFSTENEPLKDKIIVESNIVNIIVHRISYCVLKI